MENNVNLILNWLQKKNWSLLPFQKEAWVQIHSGKNGLISVPTGAGKTYAAYLPALDKLHANPKQGLQILYITPLKALAKDLEEALLKPIIELSLPYRVEKRTGDTTPSQKARQKKSLPHILLTTPESLALLLSAKEAKKQFHNLQMVIVDECHELLGSKRGVLLELSLARLKKWKPKIQLWALTATIGNPLVAAQTYLGIDSAPIIITAQMDRELIIESILPETLEKLPWFGYLGIRMLPYVLEKLDPNLPTLLFTNTRSQAERWFQGMIEAKPEWKNITALHHSSIDKKSRNSIEENIKSGALSFVFCTSALDLGIDFPLVKRVIQIGSPKSVARLIQRAGRSSHRPLTPCHIALVPTHALQLIEINAYKTAVKEHIIESKIPLKNCFDVLLQHIVTCAISGGIEKKVFYEEIKTTSCFADLTYEEYEQCIQFLISGGNALEGYSEYKKLLAHGEFLTIDDPQIIRRHRMNIGTINSDAYATVKFLKGKSLGNIEESFLSQLNPGDNFLFSGKRLKLVRYNNLTAYVRLTNETNTKAVVWGGTGLPFSAPLGKLLREALDQDEKLTDNALLQEICQIQNTKSHLPHKNEILIEIIKSREGWHLFLFPFEGTTIHDSLGLLIAHRLAKTMPSTLILSANDYGLQIMSKKPFDEKLLNSSLFNPSGCYEELQELINLHEASKVVFREIARIAGLVFQGFPGKNKSNRQLQMSTSLLFDVLKKYDSKNLLLRQAIKETLDKYFLENKLENVLKRLETSQLVITHPKHFTPFSLPLYIERVSHRLSTESLSERIKAIQNSWNKKT